MPHGPELEAFLNVVAPFYEFVRETDMQNMTIVKPLALNGSVIMNGNSGTIKLNIFNKILSFCTEVGNLVANFLSFI